MLGEELGLRICSTTTTKITSKAVSAIVKPSKVCWLIDTKTLRPTLCQAFLSMSTQHPFETLEYEENGLVSIEDRMAPANFYTTRVVYVALPAYLLLVFKLYASPTEFFVIYTEDYLETRIGRDRISGGF
jgi:hypothetical protein